MPFPAMMSLLVLDVMLDGVVLTAPSARNVLTVKMVDASASLWSATVTTATTDQPVRTPSAGKDAIPLM